MLLRDGTSGNNSPYHHPAVGAQGGQRLLISALHKALQSTKSHGGLGSTLAFMGGAVPSSVTCEQIELDKSEETPLGYDPNNKCLGVIDFTEGVTACTYNAISRQYVNQQQSSIRANVQVQVQRVLLVRSQDISSKISSCGMDNSTGDMLVVIRKVITDVTSSGSNAHKRSEDLHVAIYR